MNIKISMMKKWGFLLGGVLALSLVGCSNVQLRSDTEENISRCNEKPNFASCSLAASELKNDYKNNLKKIKHPSDKEKLQLLKMRDDAYEYAYTACNLNHLSLKCGDLINAHIKGDDFYLHSKEEQLPDGITRRLPNPLEAIKLANTYCDAKSKLYSTSTNKQKCITQLLKNPSADILDANMSAIMKNINNEDFATYGKYFAFACLQSGANCNELLAKVQVQASDCTNEYDVTKCVFKALKSKNEQDKIVATALMGIEPSPADLRQICKHSQSKEQINALLNALYGDENYLYEGKILNYLECVEQLDDKELKAQINQEQSERIIKQLEKIEHHTSRMQEIMDDVKRSETALKLPFSQWLVEYFERVNFIESAKHYSLELDYESFKKMMNSSVYVKYEFSNFYYLDNSLEATYNAFHSKDIKELTLLLNTLKNDRWNAIEKVRSEHDHRDTYKLWQLKIERNLQDEAEKKFNSWLEYVEYFYDEALKTHIKRYAQEFLNESKCNTQAPLSKENISPWTSFGIDQFIINCVKSAANSALNEENDEEITQARERLAERKGTEEYYYDSTLDLLQTVKLKTLKESIKILRILPDYKELANQADELEAKYKKQAKEIENAFLSEQAQYEEELAAQERAEREKQVAACRASAKCQAKIRSYFAKAKELRQQARYAGSNAMYNRLMGEAIDMEMAGKILRDTGEDPYGQLMNLVEHLQGF